LNRWSEKVLHITHAEYLGGHQVRLKFDDGFSGVADLAGRLTGPVFQPLNDIEAFRQFEIIGHTLSWPNGADFAPEYLRGLANGRIAEQTNAADVPIGSTHDGTSTAARG